MHRSEPVGARLDGHLLERAGLIAVVRGAFEVRQYVAVGRALLAGGVRIIELTLDSPHALAGITQLRDELGDELHVGAGTVLDAADADAAVSAGAEFIVSPGLIPDVLERARMRRVLHIPGVLTASEVARARQLGAMIVKLFPANPLGPSYLAALRAPFADVAFVPTGGIGREHLKDFVAAGAAALGIGTALVRGPAQPLGDVTVRARELVDVLSLVRNAHRNGDR